MDTIDAHGDPLAFKVAQGAAISPVVRGVAGTDTILVEARQMSHHQKEAIVQDGAQGSVWRLSSDEGVHLKGTDLAPFPLGFYNAGLQSSFAGTLVRLAAARGIVLERVAMRATTSYSLTGSFILGTGVGVAEGVRIDLDLGNVRDVDAIAALVRDAVVADPALAMVRGSLDNTFALYCNGRRRNPSTLPASTAPNATDPFLRHSAAPRPLAGGSVSDILVKTELKRDGTPVTAPAAGKAIREVVGDGELLEPGGLYRTRTGLNMPGSTFFAFAMDETGDRAPSGLATASAGIAFCYMTQISRYIENMKLPIEAVRLVQMSPYGIDAAGHGTAAPCDTHLFMNGTADEATFEKLQLVAANTCYLHQTMIHRPPLTVSVQRSGEAVWTADLTGAAAT